MKTAARPAARFLAWLAGRTVDASSDAKASCKTFPAHSRSLTAPVLVGTGWDGTSVGIFSKPSSKPELRHRTKEDPVGAARRGAARRDEFPLLALETRNSSSWLTFRTSSSTIALQFVLIGKTEEIYSNLKGTAKVIATFRSLRTHARLVTSNVSSYPITHRLRTSNKSSTDGS